MPNPFLPLFAVEWETEETESATARARVVSAPRGVAAAAAGHLSGMGALPSPLVGCNGVRHTLQTRGRTPRRHAGRSVSRPRCNVPHILHPQPYTLTPDTLHYETERQSPEP